MIDVSRTAMDMTKKNKYVTMHMNELHDTKFHNQANLKKIGYYTIFLLALIINVIFCEKYRGVSTTSSFKKKTDLNLSTSI
jgi:hypothetical protein